MLQKLIVKYGAAAHLALLAVAPLFLFPFCGEAEVATVLLWLSLPAFAWTLLAARRRVARAMFADPLTWTFLFLVLLAGVRALNGGVRPVYDGEAAAWSLSPSVLPILPGCADGAGFLPFAAVVAAAVLTQGCRHSLGRSARMAFLFVASALAGFAGVLALFAGCTGNDVVRAAVACSPTASFYVGVAFHLHLLGGTVALLAAFERSWNWTMPVFALSVGATAAAGFLLSPAFVSLVFLSAEVLLAGYVFFFAARKLAKAGEFKQLVVSAVSLALGALLAMATFPDATIERVDAFLFQEFLPDSLVSVRETLSGIALRSWLANLWLGTGLGTFPSAFRFWAAPADWQVVRAGVEAVPNGWLLLLAERGVVGAVAVGLPLGFLLFSYFRRLTAWVSTRTLCHPACCLAPLVLAALAVTGAYGCAFLRADVMIMALATLAVSANSFSRATRRKNG